MPDSKDNLRTIRGTIIKLYHSSPNFCAGRMTPVREDVPGGKDISFAGRVFVREGEAVVLRGTWEDHEKYGQQFRATERLHQECLDAAGLAAWLTHHGEASGIGPVKARKIAEDFGEDFAGVLRSNPEQIAIAARVPLENVQRLAAAWDEHEEENRIGTKLAAYGLTHNQIHALYEEFRGSLVPLLRLS